MTRGQLQTLEPIIVIIIISLIAGIGLLFFVRVSENTLERDVAALTERQLRNTLDRVTTLPELSCPQSETTNTYCIDIYKALVFEPTEDYYALFGNTKITIQWLDTIRQELVLYDAVRNPTRMKAATSYFTVYNPTTHERNFAMVVVQRDAS